MYDPVVGAEHIERFVNDSVIQEIMRERKMLYFEEWIRSDDPADRERIHAECRAFDSLDKSLLAVVNAGLHEKAQAELERRSQ